MTVEEMKRRKREAGYSLKQISELSGVPLGTVQKIFGSETKSPRYDTLQKLEKAFRGNLSIPLEAELAIKKAGILHENVIDFWSHESLNKDTVDLDHFNGKHQGEYTISDYYSLPEDIRVELIDGVFYLMTAPMTIHQMIGYEVSLQFSSFIRGRKGNCITFMAPTDVQLDKDSKTMVQPDFFIFCDRDKLSGRRIIGAPDFVLEVLSPSTSKKDKYIKLAKYKNAGVREYWMIDPHTKTIITYFFSDNNDEIPMIYGFRDKVPVKIYNDQLVVDFGMIDDYLTELKIWEKLDEE